VFACSERITAIPAASSGRHEMPNDYRLLAKPVRGNFHQEYARQKIRCVASGSITWELRPVTARFTRNPHGSFQTLASMTDEYDDTRVTYDPVPSICLTSSSISLPLCAS